MNLGVGLGFKPPHFGEAVAEHLAWSWWQGVYATDLLPARRNACKPTLIERDAEIPNYEVLQAEAERARACPASAFQGTQTV